ncbi:unnamed protein product [Ectocarpus sp. CCAP 1310/34]|nr:unnamed protein product [Ectocarpus sp. CCAP 1310/34]
MFIARFFQPSKFLVDRDLSVRVQYNPTKPSTLWFAQVYVNDESCKPPSA